MILSLLPLVRLIAAHIHRGLPSSVSLDDVISAGTLGAIDAVDHYDWRPGVELKSYAKHRIRGAILDGFREMDWTSRYHRDRWKKVEAAIAAVEREQQRAPTEEEIAARLRVSLAELREQRRGADTLLVGDYNPENDQSLSNCIPDHDPLPDAQVVASVEARRMKDAIAQLRERDQMVVRLYFYEDLTLLEIAERLGVNESRVSQLKTRAIACLRAQFGVRAIRRRVYKPSLRRTNDRPRFAEAA